MISSFATSEEPSDAHLPMHPTLPCQGGPPPAPNVLAYVLPSSATPALEPSSSPDNVPERPTGLPMTIQMEGAQNNCIDPHILGTMYRITALALSILEQEHSVKQLVCIGATSIRTWGTGPDPKQVKYPTSSCDDDRYWYRTPSDDEMGRWVHFYLQKVRYCLPTLNICGFGGRGASEGVCGWFAPRHWVQDAEDRCISAKQEPTNENVMLHWDPLDAGVIHLKAEAIFRVARLRSQHLAVGEAKDGEAIRRYGISYRACLFDGAVTVAHELVHCFIRFLSGSPEVKTPRKLLPKGYSNKYMSGWGESGRTWEKKVFGGCITLSLPQKEGGYIQIWLDKDNMVTEIDPNNIQDIIVDGKVKLPFQITGKWYRLGKA